MHSLAEPPSSSHNLAIKPLVHIVDDDPDVRRSIGRLLETIGLETRTYSMAAESIDAITADRPGCLIIDMRLPDRDGLDLLQDLRDRGISTPAIVITAFADVPAAVRAMKLCVCDFLEKPFRDQQFLAAVQKAVGEHTKHFEDEQRRKAVFGKIEELSQREKQVLQGIVAGKSSKIIASDLVISSKTVENYRAT